jgi:signal transduction histidine kinase/CheY-like chemotaxis protein
MKTKTFGLFIAIFIFLSPAFFGFSDAFAEDDQSDLFYVDLSGSTFYIREGFTEPIPDAPLINFNDSGWESAKLSTHGTILPRNSLPEIKATSPKFLSLQKSPIAEFTIATKFSLSQEQFDYLTVFTDSAPGLFLASIGDNWEIYLNGNLIAREVHLDDEGEITKHTAYKDYSTSIPIPVLNVGENDLVLRIIGGPYGGYTGLYYDSPYYVGLYDTIIDKNADNITIVFCTVYAFIGFYHLLLYLFRRSSQENLIYALFSIIAAVYFFVHSHHVYQIISDTLMDRRIEFGTLFMLPILFAAFVEILNHRRVLLLTKICAVITVVYVVALWYPNPRFVSDVLQLWQIALGLPILLYIALYDVLYTYIRTAVKHKKEKGISLSTSLGIDLVHTALGNLLSFVLLLVITIVVDILDAMYIHSGIQLSRYSLFIFSVCIAFLLAAQYTSAFKTMGRENENLEELIEDRTNELRKQVEISETASKAKSDFMATVSHEIRTPLNAILGLSEIELRKEDIPYRTKINIDKMHRSGITLKTLVDEMLDINKIETGALEINEQEYKIASIISEVINPLVVKNTGKPIIFHANIAADIPSALLGDPLRTKQVFNNILSNSLKFTEFGDVNVKFWYEPYDFNVTAAGEAPEWVYICAEFTDTGIGIKPEDIDKIFEGYSQLDMASTRKAGGTGLGLYITKKILDMMGGSIKVESTPGKGSTFTVKIPQHVEDGAPIGENAAFALANMKWTELNVSEDEKTGLDDTDASVLRGRVLVADDVALNLEVVVGMLQKYKLDIDCVLSGIDAVDKMAGSVKGENPHFDLILMDHMMPGMDGVEAMQKIRELGDYAENIPIVVLTANALEGNEELFLNSGFDAYLSKPIDPEAFENVLFKFIPQ